MRMFSLLNLYLILCLFGLINVIHSENKLKQLHVLFRHGERSPTRTYPNDPYKNFTWSGGWGHLTNRGKLQMYELGQKLRTHYNNFIPEYYWHEEVNITSSYADRCLMSAELINAGMFPPKGAQKWNNELAWQPIPVHYQPRSQDNIIAMKSNCNKYDQAFTDIMSSVKVQNVLVENESLLKHLSENTGMEVNNIEIVETLFNTLEIQKLNNLTLPPWINDTLMDEMGELGALNLALYSETEFMKRMKGGVFLKRIVTTMENILVGRNEPLLFLYSGHDLTLVHVLRSLNLVNTIKPKFGSSLIFELYSDGEVKILYRNSWDGTPETKKVGSCNTTCQFDAWRKSLDPVLPVDWAEECKL